MVVVIVDLVNKKNVVWKFYSFLWVLNVNNGNDYVIVRVIISSIGNRWKSLIIIFI